MGDLTKHEVYELAQYINREWEVIPQRVLEREPTAELRDNQIDQDSLPPYNELDALVVQALSFPPEDANGASESSVKAFSRLYALSEYKRRQLPPVIRVSSRAFGMGRRIPVVSVKPTEI